MAKITDLASREILDSRGNPTLETTLCLEDGTVARASVPSGASTGTFEAVELRDGDPKRYRGQGVTLAKEHVETEIKERVLGMEVSDQAALDTALIELDGTENKSRLGANAILSVSLAAARAAALSSGMPLYRHLAGLAQEEPGRKRFPLPMFNIANGGKHSNSGLSVQEFKIVPQGIGTYPEQLRAGSEVFHALEDILKKEGLPTGVGDEGGFAPRLESHKRQFELIDDAIKAAGYARGRDIFLDIDAAADSFYHKDENVYRLEPEHVALTRESHINLNREWIREFDLLSVEDGLYEEDWEGWPLLLEKLTGEPGPTGKPVLVIGDDFLVTNEKRLKRAISEKACNAILIKPNQIGTLTETLSTMRVAKEAGLARIISHRSGETTDDFIADLAVGAGAEYIKTGSLSRGERLVKYNRLLAIWDELL
jgi:enolase